MSKIKSSVSNERIDLASSIPLNSPLVIYLELSGFCNLSCKFCPQYTSKDELIRDTMSFELYKKIIDDLKEMEGIRVIRHIGTGEPLLNKNIIKMVSYARENFKGKIELTTNGVLLNKHNYYKELCLFHDRIIISIEALTDDGYYKIAGVKINVEDLLSGIKKLYQNRNNCHIHIKIHNNAVKEIGEKELFFKMFSPYCDSIDIENLVNLWPQLQTNLGVDAGHRFNEENKKQEICTQIFKTILINANGDIVPCCVDYKRSNLIGNINESSVREVWLSSELKNIQLLHLNGHAKKLEVCNGCEYYYSDVDNIDAARNLILKKFNL